MIENKSTTIVGEASTRWTVPIIWNYTIQGIDPAQRSEPVKKCGKVAQQNKFGVFGVALGYCISGSSNLMDYTAILAPPNSM